MQMVILCGDYEYLTVQTIFNAIKHFAALCKFIIQYFFNFEMPFNVSNSAYFEIIVCMRFEFTCRIITKI